MSARSFVADYLPTDGKMGALHRQRPMLYRLIILVGGAAFVGVVLAVAYAVLLFPLVAAQAIIAAASGRVVESAAWFGLMTAIGVGFVGLVLAVGRWVGAFVTGGEE